jgi:hypothetical protein
LIPSLERVGHTSHDEFLKLMNLGERSSHNKKGRKNYDISAKIRCEIIASITKRKKKMFSQKSQKPCWFWLRRANNASVAEPKPYK